MKINKILVVYMNPVTKKQKDSFRKIKQAIIRTKINTKVTNRNKIISTINRYDIIIVIGGDGTFLKTSHFVHDKTPILGVNLDPSKKEGFFMSTNSSDFEGKLKKLIAGKAKTIKLHRIEAFIGKKRLGFALNDIYFGTSYAYHTSYYELNINGKKYIQKSSGVIISTAAGSYAWTKSAGGKQLKLESNKFQFMVRDPYEGKLTKAGKINGTLSKTEKLKIKSLCGDIITVIDGMGPEYHILDGKTLTVSMSKKPLMLVAF